VQLVQQTHQINAQNVIKVIFFKQILLVKLHVQKDYLKMISKIQKIQFVEQAVIKVALNVSVLAPLNVLNV